MPWQLPDGMDRMRVMAALETLTGRWDPVAALEVIVAFLSLPLYTGGRTEWRLRERGSETSVTGHTELGTVRVTDRAPDTFKTFSAPGEAIVVRIGRFKVYRIPNRSDDTCSSVVFYDFRSDTRAPGQPPLPRWQLLYRDADLEVITLARLEPMIGTMTLRDRLACFAIWLRTRRMVRFETHVLVPHPMYTAPQD